MSVNKVILVGNLGRDPEIRTTQSGTKVCNFSVATSERWKDKNSGEQQERTEWNNIVIWNEHLVSVADKYLKKGSKVYLEGQLQTRKWKDQQGNDRYSTEVVLNPFKSELQMLDSKGGEAKQDRPTQSAGNNQNGGPEDFGGSDFEEDFLR